MNEEGSTRLWLYGLRRAHVASTALTRWVVDRGLTGLVWEPGAYVPEDTSGPLHSLVRSGAAPDASLLVDFVVTDCRAAARALEDVWRDTGGSDGVVCVWMHPDSLVDPGRASKSARDLVSDIGRPNVAVAFAWTGARAGALSAIVASGVPVAVSGAATPQAADGVALARTKGMERRRRDAEDPEEVEDVAVFLLGTGSREGLLGVDVTDEEGLLRPQTERPVSPPATTDAERDGWQRAAARMEARTRHPEVEDTYSPQSFAADIATEIRELDRADVLERIWARDHTVWRDDPTEISDRLGWLDVALRMRSEAAELAQFGSSVRAEGITRVVLCGMGGSSLAPEMFRAILGGAVSLEVLDTTDPDHVAGFRDRLDAERTFVIVSSKSGTTVETRSHLEMLWSLVGRGDRFVAVTDPSSELAKLGAERGFRRVFENPPDIGGRYSALSYFGLVPAAVCGVDVAALLDPALLEVLANAASVPPVTSPALRLGAAMAEAAAGDAWDGRDKLTLVLPPEIEPFGAWVEQLVAESLGKDSKGILPVDLEPLGPLSSYEDDRLFVAYAVGDAAFPSELESLAEQHPVVRIRIPDVAAVGAECFRWEMATAVCAHVLDIHPFDQPDVESAKVRARRALEGAGGPTPDRGSAPELLATLEPGDYVAVQAFLTPGAEVTRRLDAVRVALRDRLRVAVTVGFGPRFLHSTGQFHKGGPNSGVYLQVTKKHTVDVDVPGAGYTFGRLFDAQADGDLEALRDAGRRVARLDLDELEAVASSVQDRDPTT